MGTDQPSAEFCMPLVRQSRTSIRISLGFATLDPAGSEKEVRKPPSRCPVVMLLLMLLR